jgi:hypothetical protein
MKYSIRFKRNDRNVEEIEGYYKKDFSIFFAWRSGTRTVWFGAIYCITNCPGAWITGY